MIIDAHTHVFEHIAGLGRKGEVRAIGDGRVRWVDGEEVRIIPRTWGDRSFSYDQLIEIMDAHGISKAVMMHVAAIGAEGAPGWRVFWPQCHTERAFKEHNSFGRSGFPFKSKEYTNPESVDYSKVEVPNAVWHQSHTFTCFAFPTYTEEDCRQIGDALVKVIKAYSK